MSPEEPLAPYGQAESAPEVINPSDSPFASPEDLGEMMEEQQLDSEEQQEEDFYRNLAEELSDDERKQLAVRLLEDLESDEKSRESWIQGIELVYKNLGFTIEEFINPGDGKKCNATDPTFAIAWVIATANLFGALYPPEGPCKAKTLGQTTQQIENKAERMKMWMNHFLVDRDKDFYPDSNLMIGYMVLCGSAFTKTEPDPMTGMPVCRFIKPQDFVVDVNCNTILSSKRITHIQKYTKKEVLQLERSGKWIKHYTKTPGDTDDEDNSLSLTIDQQEGLDKTTAEDKDRLLVYPQMYVELDSEDLPFLKKYDEEGEEEAENSMPKPYRVSISRSATTAVDIRRNWERGDDTYKRDECFTGFKYLEGFGLMGLGLIHLAGSVSLALTSMLRQIIIAALYKNFPAGFISKDLKAEDNDLALEIGEFRAVETGDKTIQQCVSPLPYNGADPVMVQMYDVLSKKVGEIAASAQTAVPENGGANTPAETTIAYLDVVNKVQSTVLQSNHTSLGNQLQLIFKVFKRYFKQKEAYPFKVAGQTSFISAEDFTDDINIIPVSNPKILTTTHKIALAQMAMQLEEKAPDLFVKRQVFRKMLLAVNMDDIDALMKPEPIPESRDPISENMLILKSLPVLATMDQNHEAHIVIKNQFATEQKLMGNIPAYIAATENIQIHKACKAVHEMLQKVTQEYQQTMMTVPMDYNFIVNMQQQHEMKLQQFQNIMIMPTQNLLKITEIQNVVAESDLKELQQQQMMQQQQQSSQVDPNKVMLLDVQQQAQANVMKNEEAKMRQEGEAFKAQMRFEETKMKVEADRDISQERNETQMALAQMKANNEKLRGNINVKENM